MATTKITLNELRSIVKQIIKEERMLNEDNLEVKNIAKQLYSFLTKNGVKAEIVAGLANTRSTSIGTSELSAKPGENTALISYHDDPKTKQTVIYIRLNGEEQSILEVEKKIGQSFSNLEQYDRKILRPDSTNYRMEFKVKEKTTSKGGLVGNTQQNQKQPAQQQQPVSEGLKLRNYLK
jgi:hypothetical protein